METLRPFEARVDDVRRDTLSSTVKLAFAANDSILLLASDSGSLAITSDFWFEALAIDVSSGNVTSRIEARGRIGFKAIGASVDGGSALAAVGNVVRVWKLGSGRDRAIFHGNGDVLALCVHPNGRHFICGDASGAISVVPLKGGKPLAQFHLDETVTAVAVSRDGSCVVAGDGAGGVAFFKLDETAIRRSAKSIAPSI